MEGSHRNQKSTKTEEFIFLAKISQGKKPPYEKISQPKESSCENQVVFAKIGSFYEIISQLKSCENFRSCETTSKHTCANSQPQSPFFAAAKALVKPSKAKFCKPRLPAKPPPGTRVPFRSPQSPFRRKLESQPPTTESQIPYGMTPEMVIKQPMVTQPLIEGNLDCRARPFHSELCFDKETFKHQPELRDSFPLLKRYHLEHLMTPRDFF